jgi:uncharacterized protein (DUF2235 family)
MKKIVVFADGTGNAFTQQESNVWRLYEAIDLARPDQIAHYVQGVGTSSFRPWATIDAATGLGVPANVRRAYEYLCRNWHPGDEIYMFGFSRGAFTIRTLIGMIHHEGLLPAETKDGLLPLPRLREDIRAAWRSYRNKTAPFRFSEMSPLIPLVRAIRNFLLGIWRLMRGRALYATLPNEDRRRRPEIAFVGLFDTVEAYGVPIEEFRRAIDWGVWPISFRNNRISPLVRKVCHALALDDERTTFHPLRIDLPEGDPTTSERVEEVWFAGVHSNVGGGYPDDGLAHIPLVWMIERMRAAAAASETPLRLPDSALDAFKSRACPFVPTQDSRGGLATFYRYGPRVFSSHLTAEKMPVVHSSVVDKMRVGANLYTPLTLPIGSKVWAVPPNLATPITDAFAKSAGMSAVDEQMLSRVHDLVWWRRVNYFLTLVATAATVSLPWTADPIMRGIRWPFKDTQLWDSLSRASEGTSVVLGLLRAAFGFLPSYSQRWTEVFIALPFVCVPIAIFAISSYAWGRRLRDETTRVGRLAWFPPSGAMESVQQNTLARRMRHSAMAKGVRTAFAEGLTSGLIVICLYILGVVFLNHIFLSYRQGEGQLCPPPQSTAEVARYTPVAAGGTASPYPFRPSERCHASGLQVKKDTPYRLEIAATEPFEETGSAISLPVVGDVDWRSVVFWPFRRWWTAQWWQPIARIGPDGTEEWALSPLKGGPATAVGLKPGEVFAAEFTATADGEIFLFVNDALGAIPFWGLVENAYANNKGLATVTLAPVEYALPIPK